MFDTSVYIDPGVYTQEVVVPAGTNVSGLPFAVTLIGSGSRSKRVNNEAVQRGQVKAEALTFTGSPIRATLAARSSRSLDHTTLFKKLNGVTSAVPDTFVSFPAATINGAAGPYAGLVAGTVDAFSLELDRKVAIQIRLIYDVAATPDPVVTAVGGTQFNVRFAFAGLSLATATRAEVARCINAALFAASSLGYGAAYGSMTGLTGVASDNGAVLTITSPLTSPDSDVRVFPAIAQNGSLVIFGAAAVDAATLIEISPLAFDVTATWTVDYVHRADADDNLDSLVNTKVQDVRTVGSFQGIGNFTEALDWSQAGGSGLAASIVTGAPAGFMRLTGLTGMTADSVGGLLIVSGGANPANNGTFVISTFVSATEVYVANANAAPPDANNPAIRWQELRPAIDWSPDTAASLLGTIAPTTALGFDLILVAFDSKRKVLMDLDVAAAPANPVLGFTYGAGPSAADIAGNINALLANDAAYGARYDAVATLSGGAVLLTSPTQGRGSSANVYATGVGNDATNLVFGFVATILPQEVPGRGQRPALGSLYFVSYDFVKPASDYNVPFRHFTLSAAFEQVGTVSALVAKYNPLAIGAGLCFKNGAQIIFTIQLDDATAPGSPSQTEVNVGLDAAKVLEACTEIIVIDSAGTGLAVKTDVVAHLEQQNGPLEKHFRRGWFGYPAGTAIGDRDTSGTMVFEATRTLQVAPSSPARGRMFAVAPPQKAGLTSDLSFEEGGTIRQTLDSTYLAVAVAALRSALLKPSDSLARRTIRGFNVDDITLPWLKQERAQMADNGILVITHDAGRLIMLDPITTEGGGGGLVQFKQDSSSYQKDNTVRKVNLALDANVVGIVPFDIANFIIDIKLIIANVISGEISAQAIGPYRDDATGAIRAIDLRRDIIVVQKKTDPRKFFFNYWFNLLYPALYIMGEYSVDRPHFSRNLAP